MSVAQPDEIITILLVEDIAEIRGNVKANRSFGSDFGASGMTGTDQEGLAMAKRLTNIRVQGLDVESE